MLDVDVERIEAGGAGDAGDLHGAHEPHRHRRHHFVPLELLLDIVVQDVAYLHGGPSLLPWPWPALDRPGPTVVWQSRLAVKLMARRPPHSWVSTGSPRS